jgi:hypothetical protein
LLHKVGARSSVSVFFLAKEQLLFFAWASSGLDKLSFKVEENNPRAGDWGGSR